VLACLKEDAVVTIPEVYKASQCDPDELARASMVLALGSLTLPKEPYLQHLKDLMSNAESGLIKVAAATALSNLEKEQIPPEVIEVLINAICSPKPVADLYSRLPWIHMYWTSDDISVQAGKELLYLGYDKVKFAVPRLIEFFKEALASYRSANTFEALLSLRNMVYILLSLVFNEKPVVPNTNVQQLTDDQRMVLATITEVTNGWADVSELLQEFGLPVSRDELQRFLRGEISLPDTPDEIFGSLGW
jgi:hypothetical protein